MPAPRAHIGALHGNVNDTPGAIWNRDVSIVRADDVACPSCQAPIGSPCPDRFCRERLDLARATVEPEIQPWVPQSYEASFNYSVAKSGAQRKITQSDIIRIRKLRAAGHTVASIAERYGCSTVSVYRHLSKAD